MLKMDNKKRFTAAMNMIRKFARDEGITVVGTIILIEKQNGTTSSQIELIDERS